MEHLYPFLYSPDNPTTNCEMNLFHQCVVSVPEFQVDLYRLDLTLLRKKDVILYGETGKTSFLYYFFQCHPKYFPIFIPSECGISAENFEIFFQAHSSVFSRFSSKSKIIAVFENVNSNFELLRMISQERKFPTTRYYDKLEFNSISIERIIVTCKSFHDIPTRLFGQFSILSLTPYCLDSREFILKQIMKKRNMLDSLSEKILFFLRSTISKIPDFPCTLR